MTDDAGEACGTSPLCREDPGRSGDPVSPEKPGCNEPTAAAPAATKPAAAMNSVLLFTSEDCSGEPTGIDASTPMLALSQ